MSFAGNKWGWVNLARLCIVAPCLAVPVLPGDFEPAEHKVNPVDQQRSDTIVRIVSAPRYAGVATLVSEASIGGASAAADEYIFSAVTEVLPLRDGSIIVADRGSGNSVFVRVYNAQGKYVRTLGRFGEGPGEYVAPSGLGELLDGRIVVRDGRGGRINIYSAAGEGQGQQLVAANYSGTSTGAEFLLIAPDGTIQLRAPSRALTGTRPAIKGGYARLRPDGTLIDTLFAPELPRVGPPQLEARSTSNGGSSTTSTNLPFSPISISTFSPLGYFVTARTDRYALDVRIPPTRVAAGSGPRMPWVPGDAVTSIRYHYTPVPVNDAERAEQRKRVEEQMRTTDSGWQWSGPDIPRVKPAFKAIRTGLDGRLWVQVSTPSERFDPGAEPPPSVSGGGSGGGSVVGGGAAGGGITVQRPTLTPLTWREPLRYDVFDPDGTYQGAVAVPYNTSVSAMRGDHVWGIVKDTDGVQSVHRFRIAWKQ